MSSMSGKVALVTGGTDGIGKHTAIGLAQLGAEVVIVGRSAEKGANVLKELQAAHPAGKGEFIQADFSLMREVRRVAEIVRARHNRLDLLIHSAGVINTRRILTDEGLEMTFAVDYLSRFLLTNLLLDRLQASAPARIINVAASGGGLGSIDFEDLQGERRIGGMRGLGQAQFANDVFTLELHKRLQGTGVSVMALHPGAVDTGIRRELPRWINFLLGIVAKPFAMTPEQGAQAPLYLATAPELANVSGALFQRTKRLTPSAKTLDPELGRKLWEVSEALTNMHMPATI
jgi:NAD(P)-dependent dehydrogenase (short-subunit alcohol dehydrogenase family)